MGSFRLLAVAGVTALATLSGANAADLGRIVDRGPPPQEDFASGWYLRGDVGVGINTFRSFDYTKTNDAFVWPASWNIDHKNITESFIIGGGVGFYFNSWLRFDVTGEYRSASRFKAVGGYTEFCAGGGRCFDVYDGHHSSAVVLANAYFELGTWGRFTPFIGAGVGGAYHMVSGVWDLGLNSDGTTGRGFAGDRDEFKFAWAAHAGVAYDVTNNLKIELAYRYLNMGNVRTNVIDCQGCGVINGPLAYYTLRDLDSHDIKIGLRWMLDAPPPPPLMRKG